MVGSLERIYLNAESMAPVWEKRKPAGKVVFTNGCFDILHAGHVEYLTQARSLGEFLVIGLNSDASIRRLKGILRPMVPFADRATVLAGLRAVDLVIGFAQDTPLKLIQSLRPTILVKGGDWQPSQIVGGDWVLANGGEVRSLQFKPGSSTTSIIDLILARHGVHP